MLFFFFFNDTATTEIYTLSLHDALPIYTLHGLSSAVTYPRFSGTSVPRDFVEFPSQVNEMWALWPEVLANYAKHVATGEPLDRKSTRLNSSHANISYAVFCLKKKKKTEIYLHKI